MLTSEEVCETLIQTVKYESEQFLKHGTYYEHGKHMTGGQSQTHTHPAQ